MGNETGEVSSTMLRWPPLRNTRHISDSPRSRLAKLRMPKAAVTASNVSSNCYITTSRQVNWKRIDLAVKACAKTGRELVVVGEGPEHKNLVKMAEGHENVKFLPLQDRKELAGLLAGARGYLFPSMEPFGIAPVEALAAGCPVIAYGEGGALDYVVDGKNGVLFDKQTVKSLELALDRFEKMKLDPKDVRKTSEKFAVKRFDSEIREFVNEKIK